MQLEDGSIERHKGERKVKVTDDDDALSVTDSTAPSAQGSDDVETDTSDGSASEEEADVEKDSLSSNREDKPNLAVPDTAEKGNENEEERNQLKEETHESQASKDSEDLGLSVKASSTVLASEKKQEFHDVSADLTRVSLANDENDNQFPDTSISLLHVRGDK